MQPGHLTTLLLVIPDMRSSHANSQQGCGAEEEGKVTGVGLSNMAQKGSGKKFSSAKANIAAASINLVISKAILLANVVGLWTAEIHSRLTKESWQNDNGRGGMVRAQKFFNVLCPDMGVQSKQPYFIPCAGVSTARNQAARDAGCAGGETRPDALQVSPPTPSRNPATCMLALLRPLAWEVQCSCGTAGSKRQTPLYSFIETGRLFQVQVQAH